MKIPLYFFPLCALSLSPQVAYSESLEHQAKQELIETLKEILQGNKTRERSAISTAMDAFRPAAMDDKAAYALYENCIRKKEFTEKDKNDSEWRKWKNANKEKSNDIAYRKALQYQCQWALITLQAASAPQESFDASQYAPQIVSILESIGSNYKDLKKRKGDLSSDLLQGPIGDVYGVSQIKPDPWPGNLMDVGDIFETLIFPKYRETLDVRGLRGAWDKRIRLEAQFLETKDEELVSPEGGSEKEGKKRSRSSISSNRSNYSSGSMVATRLTKPNSADKDLTRAAHEALTALRWMREVDCCKIGDEAQASSNMLNIIKTTRDSKIREARIQELMTILVPPPKSKVSNKSRNSDSSPFGSANLTDDDEVSEDLETKPSRELQNSSRTTRNTYPSSLSVKKETIQESAEDKPIVAIVEEVTTPQPEPQKRKVSNDAAKSKGSQISSEIEPTSSEKKDKVDDDFFDE